MTSKPKSSGENGRRTKPAGAEETAQRILNLFFVLNTSAQPLTTDQIVSDSDLGYGSGNVASDKKKFQRDRAKLLEHGIIVREVKDRGASETEESAWTVDRERTFAAGGLITSDDADLLEGAIAQALGRGATPLATPLKSILAKIERLGAPAVGTPEGLASRNRQVGRGHDPVDTLANQPTFPWHMENLRNYITASSDFPQDASWRSADLKPYGAGAGMRGIPGDCYSTSRFVKAAYLNANYPQKDTEAENVIRMFRSLEGVAMVEGSSKMGDGKFEKTIYTGCFSGRTGNYYYATYDDPAIRYVSLADAEGADPTELVCPEPRLR